MSRQPYKLDASDRTLLSQELDLIRIIHHRNKNQHHGAPWFKYIKYLKSSLTRILSITPIDSDRAPISKNLAEQEREFSRFEREREAFLARVRPMYISFTMIIGTWQYASLGMILLGVLARVWKVVQGPINERADPGESDDGGVSKVELDDDSGFDFGVIVDRREVEHSVTLDDPVLSAAVSLPSRSRSPKVPQTSKSSLPSSLVQSPHSSSKSKNKQKSKKKRKAEDLDDIDKIFG